MIFRRQAIGIMGGVHGPADPIEYVSQHGYDQFPDEVHT